MNRGLMTVVRGDQEGCHSVVLPGYVDIRPARDEAGHYSHVTRT